MRCRVDDMGARNVHNVWGRSMARRINVVVADSIYGFVWSSKLRATTWTWLVNYGIGNGGWAKDNGFLSGQFSIGVLRCTLWCLWTRRILSMWWPSASLQQSPHGRLGYQVARRDTQLLTYRLNYWAVIREIFGHNNRLRSLCLQVQPVTCSHPPVFLY